MAHDDILSRVNNASAVVNCHLGLKGWDERLAATHHTIPESRVQSKVVVLTTIVVVHIVCVGIHEKLVSRKAVVFVVVEKKNVTLKVLKSFDGVE